MLYITQFIKNHPLLWEELLTQEPYNLKVKRDEEYKNLILLMYDMINSDFSEPIVKEARGIIIDIEDIYNPVVVCQAFNKFFNYGEQEAAEIDWSTARVQEKVDGSLVKLWYYNKIDKWILSSNSCIQASKAELASGYNLEKLFLMAIRKYDCKSIEEFVGRFYLTPYCTYIFELVSPYNQVVVQYSEPDIYFIGARHIVSTIDEISINTEVDLSNNIFLRDIKQPKSYSLSTLEDCIEAAKALNTDGKVENEGFVVVDANWNRVKIKSPDYVAMHHLVNGLSREDLLHIIRIGEVKEVLNYFPKYEMIIKEMARDYGSYQRDLIKKNFAARKRWKELNQDRKAFAIEYSKKNFPEVFKLLDMDWKWNKYLKGLTDKQLLKNIDRYKAN